MRVSAAALDAAREQLRARQGAGVRHDSSAAPHSDLALARAGTAYFLRELDRVADDELTGPSRLPEWSRAEIVAHVGYNARALSRLCRWAASGIEEPMYASPAQRADEIRAGGTLPPHALRALVNHAQVELDAAWRELSDRAWRARVRTAQGREVPADETPWMRAREVWVHAVDLDTGATFDEFDPALLRRLLADVVASWERRGEQVNLTLLPTDARPLTLGPGSTTVSGRLASIVQWVTGRGQRNVSFAGTRPPDLPRWL